MTALSQPRPLSSPRAGAGAGDVSAGRPPGLYFAGVVPFPPALTRPRANATMPSRDTNPRLGVDPAYDFLDSLLDQAGLQIEQYRPGALLRRVPACLRALGVKTIDEAARRLAARPALAWSLLDVVLLGVTEFCRDPAVFQYLKAAILPQFGLKHARARIWSAGCSEGQELYSVAACLAEVDLLERSELLGTDCRPEAIARARLGEYVTNGELVAPEAWQRAHLLRTGDGVRIHPRLRVATTWRVSDLLGQVEPGPWHLIFCRNLAIYLESPVAAALWRRLGEQLSPGGYLITGKAENPAATGSFTRVAPCVYQTRPER